MDHMDNSKLPLFHPKENCAFESRNWIMIIQSMIDGQIEELGKSS